ncbi:Retrovirus-related Pol polyprotein from transposon 412-like protein, partial [Dinothrombium tinctorium]
MKSIEKTVRRSKRLREKGQPVINEIASLTLEQRNELARALQSVENEETLIGATAAPNVNDNLDNSDSNSGTDSENEVNSTLGGNVNIAIANHSMQSENTTTTENLYPTLNDWREIYEKVSPETLEMAFTMLEKREIDNKENWDTIYKNLPQPVILRIYNSFKNKDRHVAACSKRRTIARDKRCPRIQTSVYESSGYENLTNALENIVLTLESTVKPPFFRDTMDANQWMKKYERAAMANMWNERQKIMRFSQFVNDEVLHWIHRTFGNFAENMSLLGDYSRPLGESIVEIKFENSFKNIVATSMTNMSEDVVLGNDFNKIFNCKIDFLKNEITEQFNSYISNNIEMKTVVYKDKSTQTSENNISEKNNSQIAYLSDESRKIIENNSCYCNSEKNKQARAYLENAIKILPKTAKIVNLSLKYAFEKGYLDVTILKKYPNLGFSCPIIFSNDVNSYKIMIGNFGDEIAYMPKNLKIGKIIEIDENYHIIDCNSVESKRSFKSEKVNLDVRNFYSYEDVKINPNLTDQQRKRVLSLLEKYKDVFSARHDDLGYCDIYKHKIETIDDEPIAKRPYKMSIMHQNILKKIVNDFERAGLISPSCSNYASPAMLVAKPSLKNAQDVNQPQHYRLVVDYRFLNKKTKADVYPLPLMETSIEKFAGKKFYSKFDVTMGFYEIALDENSKEKSAFVTPFGLYQFNVMPMGLKNSPSSFQRTMNKVLKPLSNECVAAYVDDIAGASNDFDSHLNVLEKIFIEFRKARLKLKPPKSEVFLESIIYLGHKLSCNGIEPDPKKIECIDKIPIPNSKRELQSFLGTVNFYRKFIKNFSIKARPLYDLLKDNIKFVWNEECNNSFKYLKEMLKKEPILTVYNPEFEIELRTDACDEGIGAVFIQKEYDGEKVVQYASTSFKDYQKKWHITHKEFYALYWAITKEFKHFLYGRKFTVHTDSKSITFFRNSKNLNPRLIRMISELEIFDFEVIYKPGKENFDADLLSRIKHNQVKKSFLTTKINNKSIINQQKQDEEFQQILQEIENSQNKFISDFFFIEGILYHYSKIDNEPTFQLYVPKSMRFQILKLCHDSPESEHFGFKSTLERVKLKYFWPNMKSDIEDYCKTCHSCQINKPSRKLASGVGQILSVSQPFERVQIDIMGPFTETERKNKYIVSAIDQLTKYVEMRAIPNQDAYNIGKFIHEEIMTRHCPPLYLMSDRGRVFISEIVQSIVAINPPTIQQYTSGYHPKSNGTIERVQGALKNVLKTFCYTNDADWDLQQYFTIGDTVMLRNRHFDIERSHKLQSTYEGPYLVISRNSPCLYTIQLISNPETRRKVNIELLEPYFLRDDEKFSVCNQRCEIEEYNDRKSTLYQNIEENSIENNSLTLNDIIDESIQKTDHNYDLRNRNALRKPDRYVSSIIWEETEFNAVVGTTDVIINIKFISPCYVFEDESLGDMVVAKNLKDWCEDLFNTQIIENIKEICPLENFDDHHVYGKVRNKRFVVVGAILIGAAVIFGLSVWATVRTSKNAKDIKNLQKEVNELTKISRKHAKEIAQLRVDLTEVANNLENLTKTVKNLVKDFTDLRSIVNKGIVLVSRIASHFEFASRQIKSFSNSWKIGKITQEFFDLFNITLPFMKSIEKTVRRSKRLREKGQPVINEIASLTLEQRNELARALQSVENEETLIGATAAPNVNDNLDNSDSNSGTDSENEVNSTLGGNVNIAIANHSMQSENTTTTENLYPTLNDWREIYEKVSPETLEMAFTMLEKREIDNKENWDTIYKNLPQPVILRIYNSFKNKDRHVAACSKRRTIARDKRCPRIQTSVYESSGYENLTNALENIVLTLESTVKPPFFRDTMDANQWMKKYERAAMANMWNERQKIMRFSQFVNDEVLHWIHRTFGNFAENMSLLGDYSRPLGESIVEIKFENSFKNIVATSMTNMSEDVVLGNDFNKIFNCKIDFLKNEITEQFNSYISNNIEMKTVVYKDKSTQTSENNISEKNNSQIAYLSDESRKIIENNSCYCNSEKNKQARAYLENAIKILPKTAKIVNLSLKYAFEKGYLDVTILKKYPNLGFSCPIIFSNDVNSYKIMIGNFGDEIAYMPKNLKIGKIIEIDENYHIIDCNSVESKRSFKSEKVNLDVRNFYSYEDVKINPNLTDQQRKRVLSLLEKYKDVFSARHDDLGYCDIYKHKIETIDDEPIAKRPYKMSIMHQNILKKIVNDFERAGLISPSCSNYASPAMLVAKPSLKNAQDVNQPQHYRLVVDYRFLNKKTKADVYPLPLMETSIEKFAGKKFYSKFDVTMGFYEIALDENSKEKSAFVTPFGLYQFNVMPMGLKNSPSSFQRTMNKVLKPLSNECVAAYVDDIAGASNDFDSHLNVLEKIFIEFRKARLKLKPPKSEVFLESIIYLGHKLSCNGIEPDPKKIECIDKIPIPNSKRELQSFLGTVNFYRKFIKNFSIKARPLYDLLKDNIKFVWNEECNNSFKYLKEMLKKEPILTVYNPEFEIELRTDACDEGIGAVFIQKEYDGEKVVQYASTSFKDYQKKWHITHKEFYALYWAITKEFKHFLYGRKFTVHTDSKSITFFRNSKNLNPRLIRMISELEIFDFEVIYKPGKENFDADLLSRIKHNQVKKSFLTTKINNKSIINQQKQDEEFQQILQEIENSQNKFISDFFFIEGILYHYSKIDNEPTFQLYVPKSMRFQILKLCHDSPESEHFGFKSTLERVKLKYFWPNMKSDIEDYCKTCHSCQINKPSRKLASGVGQILSVSQPFERVQIDIMGPFTETERKNKYIVSAIDQLTKYVEMRAIPNQDAYNIGKFIHEEIMTRHCPPLYLMSDRGRVFISEIVQSIVAINPPTIQQYTSGYHPKSNGTIERVQ